MTALRVFVDTGAWFAIQTTDDEWHAAAARTLRHLLAGPHSLVTTNHVIGETYTLLRMVRGYPAAARFLGILRKSTRVQRVFVTDDMERRAVATSPPAEEMHSLVPAVSAGSAPGPLAAPQKLPSAVTVRLL